MADFRGMSRGGPPQNMMRPIGPGPMMPGGPVKQPIFPTLCPDFMKGVCSVFQCPKNHPEASLLFCQPYQRDCCQQGQACSYMHVTAEEEQYYKDTGLIPLRFMNKPIRMERGKGPLSNGQPSLFPTDNTPTTPTETFPPDQNSPHHDITGPDNNKHKLTEPEAPAQVIKRQKVPYEELEVERNMLKEKVKILEKKVENLDAANDVLLEKNAKLRSSSKRSPDRRSPDRHGRGRRDRRDRSRDRRSRSKERARSKETNDGNNWKNNDQNSRGNNNNRGGFQSYSTNNNHSNFNRPM